MKHAVRNKIIAALVATTAILAAAWWESFDSIGDILAHPSLYEGRTVNLIGRVGTSYSVPFVGSLYKLNDTSGGIWVLSRNDSTPTGTLLFVKGRLRSASEETVRKIRDKLAKILPEREIPSLEATPFVLKEEERGGLLRSLHALRVRK